MNLDNIDCNNIDPYIIDPDNINPEIGILDIIDPGNNFYCKCCY